jgi:hypothetical protein
MFLALVLSLACRNKDEPIDTALLDLDGDGLTGADDCDEDNPDIYVGADELCDGIDSDCDGIVDEGAIDAPAWYPDTDEDGYGAGVAVNECDAPSGHVATDDDCDDASADFHPGATEDDCTDPNDYNCDGSVGYADADGDGFPACEDCDDSEAAVNPAAVEECNGIDDSCAGSLDAAEVDDDGDGYVDCIPADDGWVGDEAVLGGGDCDDTNAWVFPTAEEHCDGLDSDCLDGAGADEVDVDGDGYVICTLHESGWSGDSSILGGDDCLDSDATVYPGADELCDGLDNDCDGAVTDEEKDDDGDFYVECAVDGDGWDGDSSIVGGQDCDDDESTVNPGATELCDGLDNDCDGVVTDDENDDDGDFYVECAIDGDGWDGDSSIVGGEDCDDDESTVNPGATELCDGLDNDCSGAVEDEEKDDDGDFYVECTIDANGWDGDSSIVAGEDCDDDDSTVNPGATELCDGQDNDCDGSLDADENDDDGDFYVECTIDSGGWDGSSSIVGGEDCDDGDATENPGASEVCDGEDDDCDSDVDEGVLGTGSSCPADDCQAVYDDGSTTTGTYSLSDSTGTAYDAYCNQDEDGGGWTLIGSVVNEASTSGSHARNWNSYAVWTDTTTFGSISNRESADYKGQAFSEVSGDDVFFQTANYEFAFYNVVGTQSYAAHVAAEYPTSCNQNFLASGADYSSGLSTTQDASLSYLIRPKDSNAQCFPTSNENAIIGLQLASCCWAGGLGNTPAGQNNWDDYDNSMMLLSSWTTETCTASNYPCNDNGYVTGALGYTYSNKEAYTLVYVR